MSEPWDLSFYFIYDILIKIRFTINDINSDLLQNCVLDYELLLYWNYMHIFGMVSLLIENNKDSNLCLCETCELKEATKNSNKIQIKEIYILIPMASILFYRMPHMCLLLTMCVYIISSPIPFEAKRSFSSVEMKPSAATNV